MMRKYDVVVIGGGAIGSSIAYWLAANPDFDGSVAVIEKDPTYEFSTTARSNSSIRLQFSTALNIRISQFGIHFLQNLADYLTTDGDIPDVSYFQGGYLFLAETETEKRVLLQNHAIQLANGVTDVVALEPDKLKQRFSWLNTEGLSLGTLGLKGEGWFDPYSLLCAFKRKARSLGADYIKDEVITIERQGDRVASVSLKSGETIACGTVVNAAGAWAGQVAAMAGVDLPVFPRRRLVFVVSCQTEIRGMPLVIDPQGFYMRPEGKYFICGMKPPADQDLNSHSFDVDYNWFDETLWPILARWVPAFEAVKMERGWAGHYEYNTFDRNALLGYHPGIENMVFANGFSGHGMQQCPAVGRGISELITHGNYRSLDLSEFSVARLVEGKPIIEQYVV
jgi:glycine/D-amino acid oxidase-like deaminating enzyme